MYNHSMPRLPFSGLLFAVALCAQPDTVTKIVDGVWMREGDLSGKGHCNNAVIEMKDYLIVVDANFPSGAEALMADIKKLSPKPVKYVLLTHHHGDHAYGSAVWTRAGAITVAHAGVTQEMARYEPKRWQGDLKERADVKAIGTPDLERPKETFTKSPWVATDGTRRVEFHHFGWGHTRGDGFVNGAYNFTADAHLANWPKILTKVKARLPVTHVIPGHGPAGGVEVLDGQTQFLASLRSEVVKALKSGKKLSDLIPDNDEPSLVKITLPDAAKRWIGRPFAGQVKDAYREVTEKKPAGDLPH
jgi:cyclase